MDQELRDSAVLRNPETGAVVILAGGSPLPTWAEGLVGDHLVAPLGTAAAAEETARQAKAEARAEARRRAIAAAADEAPLYDDGLLNQSQAREDLGLGDEPVVDGADGEGEGEVPPVPEPPRAGRGSGLEAWTSYAEAIGLEVPEGTARDELIELVDEHHAGS